MRNWGPPPNLPQRVAKKSRESCQKKNPPRYRFDVREHLRFSGQDNELVVAFKSPVLHARREFEEHKKSRYIVPMEGLPEYFNGFNHSNFIRCKCRLYAQG